MENILIQFQNKTFLNNYTYCKQVVSNRSNKCAHIVYINLCLLKSMNVWSFDSKVPFADSSVYNVAALTTNQIISVAVESYPGFPAKLQIELAGVITLPPPIVIERCNCGYTELVTTGTLTYHYISHFLTFPIALYINLFPQTSIKKI